MKKRILITDTAPLYPPLWGGPKRIWNLYSNFSQDLFEITYVGLGFNLGNGLRYNFIKIRDNFREILCTPLPHYYLWRIFGNVIFKNTSLDLFVYLWMHTDWQFKYILNSQYADIVICSHPWSSLSIRKRRGQFFIYDAHNCEYLLMGQIIRKHPLKRLILRQIKKIEADACKKSDLILACSENEKKDFISLYKVDPNKIVIVNNGANARDKTELIDKGNNRKKLGLSLNEKVVIFIGSYYKPNIDAARFIIERIARELKEFQFLIVGTVLDALKREIVLPNIKLLGRVSEEELAAVLCASDIAINPMFDGSGTNIKMLDYMSYGLPVVATECGARGIETFGKQAMVVSAVDRFTDNIKALADNDLLCRQMSEDGISLVSQYYNWKMISKKLQDNIIEKFRYK